MFTVSAGYSDHLFRGRFLMKVKLYRGHYPESPHNDQQAKLAVFDRMAQYRECGMSSIHQIYQEQTDE